MMDVITYPGLGLKLNRISKGVPDHTDTHIHLIMIRRYWVRLLFKSIWLSKVVVNEGRRYIF